MNARTLSQFMLANITLVIDRQGQIRELTAGAQPAPGEVVVTVGDGANPQVTAQEVLGDEGQTPLNLDFDAEIANIIAQLEDGVDPTLNPDQATAAGGTNGSALGTSGTVIMQLASLIAATAFSTEGFARSSLSQTESLNEDLVQDEPPTITAIPFAVEDVPNILPVFTESEYTSEDGEDDNYFVDDSEEGGDTNYSYYFTYQENSPTGAVVGQVAATDVDSDDATLTYEITNNVTVTIDGVDYDAYGIDNNGNIYLTDEGAQAFTNDFEDKSGEGGLADNSHILEVTVTDINGGTAIATVYLEESNQVSGSYVLEEVNETDSPVMVDIAVQVPEAGDIPEFVLGAYAPTSVNQVGDFSLPDGFDNPEDFGTLTYTESGWKFEASDAFNSMNTGDSLTLSFEVTSDDGAIHKVDVKINGTNDAPVFEGTIYTDATSEDGYNPGNSFDEAEAVEGEDPTIATYSFYYDENSDKDDVIGKVQASDVDNENLIYAITENISVTVDNQTFDLYEINPETGEISLTALAAELYANYEDADNDHQITVSVRDVFGEEGSETYGEPVYATVNLYERNVNEAPKGEDFTVSVGSESDYIQVVFETGVNTEGDHISDEDVDFFSQNPTYRADYEPNSDSQHDSNQDLYSDQTLSIYLTALPEYGSLYVKDGDSYTRIEDSNLYGGVDAIAYDPNSIYYKVDDPSDFTMSIDNVEEAGDGVYSFKLVNGAVVTVSATSTHGDDNKGQVTLETNPGNSENNQGIGFGVDRGNGIGSGETLIFDLSDNPLYSVDFGIDGLNSNHMATVVYTYLDGTSSEPYSYGNGSLSQSSEGVYSVSDDNPIVRIEFYPSEHTNGGNSGSNYVVTYISGEEAVVNDPTFEYTVVDSEGAMPVDEDDNVVTYEVTLDVENGVNIVYADTGDDTLEGDDRSNIFTWLDSALDNSTDTVKNFTLGTDTIEIGSILTDESTEQDIAQLLANEDIVVSRDNNDVVLTVNHGEGEQQTIVIEDIYTIGTEFAAADLLADLAKVSESA